jgi:hypothetical protein
MYGAAQQTGGMAGNLDNVLGASLTGSNSPWASMFGSAEQTGGMASQYGSPQTSLANSLDGAESIPDEMFGAANQSASLASEAMDGMSAGSSYDPEMLAANDGVGSSDPSSLLSFLQQEGGGMGSPAGFGGLPPAMMGMV